MSPMATVNKPTKDKDPSGKNPKKSEASTSPIEDAKEYFLGVRSEWSKISWPTWPQIWGQTIVVLIMVALVTFGLFVLDYGLHTIISLITPHRS